MPRCRHLAQTLACPQAYFGQFGEIEDVVAITEGITRRPRGFGFITYVDVAVADLVLESRFHVVANRYVEVKQAIPRAKTEVLPPGAPGETPMPAPMPPPKSARPAAPTAAPFAQPSGGGWVLPPTVAMPPTAMALAKWNEMTGGGMGASAPTAQPWVPKQLSLAAMHPPVLGRVAMPAAIPGAMASPMSPMSIGPPLGGDVTGDGRWTPDGLWVPALAAPLPAPPIGAFGGAGLHGPAMGAMYEYDPSFTTFDAMAWQSWQQQSWQEFQQWQMQQHQQVHQQMRQQQVQQVQQQFQQQWHQHQQQQQQLMQVKQRFLQQQQQLQQQQLLLEQQQQQLLQYQAQQIQTQTQMLMGRAPVPPVPANVPVVTAAQGAGDATAQLADAVESLSVRDRSK